MSSTRYSQQPLQIYQDPVSSFDRAPMPSAQNSRPKKLSPLRQLKNAASRKNIVFNPPQSGVSKQSPFKSAHQTSSSPSRAPFGTKLNAISMPPPGGKSHNTDSMEKKQPLMSKFKPQKALFTDFTNNASTDKENYPQPAPFYHAPMPQYNDGLPSASNFSLEGLYPQKPPTKRLLDAAPIHDSRPFKKTRTEEVVELEDNTPKELPAPDSFPPLHDDGSKPPHSYAQLIGMSILRAPNRRLTLAQIYKWISDTYSFYCATDAGWQNSIRHNLSLNKAFIKQERPKDDPGKGNYWAIVPGMEHQFIKDKTTRKPANSNDNGTVLSQFMPVTSSEQSHFKTLVPAPPELPPSSSQPTYSMPEPEPQLQTITEISSDATIPASDAFISDPEPEEEVQMPSSPLIRSSPPMMNSSPPVSSRHAPKRHDTPPPVPRFPMSSTSRSRKRKYSAMDDSGYFSSLDSSAMRPNRLLNSEADRPRLKRGRAEEEIARLRGSSYDSPTKTRAMFGPPSSSPLRKGMKVESSQMLPPLTPIVKLKPPVRPPPSASPNTNLRLHRDKMREMVGSPLRGMTCLETENVTPWSPAFQLDDNNYMFHDFNTDFDIFDSAAGLLSVPGNGSPEKRSAKRPRLEKSKSASILGDLSTSALNKSITSTPLLKLTPKVNSSRPLSPLKGFGLESPSKLLGLDSPTKFSSSLFAYDVFDYTDDFFNPDVTEDVSETWDIMQGFQRIGAGASQSKKNTPKGKSPKATGRPTMHSRSFTSRF